MGSTTSKGYPFPVGTDRVMDGDDAIRALAEAVDSDSRTSKATTLGQSLTAQANNWVSWNAAAPNECELTKTNAYTWTVTLAGIYVVSAFALTTGFQAIGARSYMQLVMGPAANAWTARASFAGENTCAPALVAPLAVGDTITFMCVPNAGTSIAAGTGILTVARLGRT